MLPEELAEGLGLTTQAYLDLEAGRHKVTGDQILILARLLYRDFRFFVAGDFQSAEEKMQAFYRANASLSKEDRVAIQQFARLCAHEAELERILGRSNAKAPPKFRGGTEHRGHFKTQGSQAAVSERNRLVIGRQPIGDIFDLIRQEGVRVFRRQLGDSNISGLFLAHPDAGPCVLVNYSEDLFRQNFSAAHEYCHVLFDSGDLSQVSYAEKASLGDDERKREWRCNAFAGEFLVPEERIKRDYRQPQSSTEAIQTIRAIAERFKVNGFVAIIRLKEIGWISEDTFERLKPEARQTTRLVEKLDPEVPESLSLGTRERISSAIRGGVSWNYLDLGCRAYQEGHITYGKLVEILGIGYEEGAELLAAVGLYPEVSYL